MPTIRVIRVGESNTGMCEQCGMPIEAHLEVLQSRNLTWEQACVELLVLHAKDLSSRVSQLEGDKARLERSLADAKERYEKMRSLRDLSEAAKRQVDKIEDKLRRPGGHPSSTDEQMKNPWEHIFEDFARDAVRGPARDLDDALKSPGTWTVTSTSG